MSHILFIQELEKLDPPTPAACFVLVWTWLLDYGVGHAENHLRAGTDGLPSDHHPVSLKPYPESASASRMNIRQVIRKLRGHMESPDDFDPLVLRWLKGLDLYLHGERDNTFAQVDLSGIHGDPYQIHRRNNFIGSYYLEQNQAVNWDADRSGALAAYTPHHVLVPVGRRRGRSIVSLAQQSWAGRHLSKQLNKARQRLRVMIWPLTIPVRFTALENVAAAEEMTFVSLRTVANEDEIEKEILEALNMARDQQVTLLLLPELCVTPKIQQAIQDALQRHGVDGHPLLTLFGGCHRPSGSGDLDLNEAILLGADGSELHRYSKQAAFTNMGMKLAERLDVGDILSVLESPLGNLVPLICLDLFHDGVSQLVRESHGNVFLVPSWSEKTSAHDNAAKRLQGSMRASTFVCNRRFKEPLDHPEGTSFYYVPCRKPDKDEIRAESAAHRSDPQSRPYLLFELGARPFK